MATYVIGDIQGCFATLMKLLEAISFDKNSDELILLGDVVNRGPSSLEVMRFIVENQNNISTVLGNHDILAIALHIGAIKDRPNNMQALLEAKDAGKLIDWLRHRPLIIKRNNAIFVHAGILPSVSIEEAIKEAEHAQEKLQKDEAKVFLARFYERRLGRDSADIKDQSLEALIYLTVIRMCAAPNVMATYDGDLAHAPEGITPWFMMRNDAGFNIYFGHWAALGLYQYKNYYCLDSGCVWGNQLSALRLEDQKIFSVENAESV
ncbi:MAG TPA: symmetrical bis(5'-nucleosyl)-tetraphosphatase [Myxococcota bacterium]|nr:symmetrical bis(5'-nucleosyl)-tetraphosphatase [Myxococcota bacterium]